jgi:thymidylate synthase
MYLLVVFWFCTFQAISTAAPYWTIDDADILKRQLKETVANSHSDVKQAYYAAKLLSRFNDSLNICSSEIIVNGEYEDLNSSKGLHPCAYETIFTVRKNHRNKLVLDMTLMQRSSDYLVAKTINSVQYVALQMMIAQHCEYGLGKFNHFIQNVHIYDRHMDALKELLEKEPINVQPKLGLWYEKNFYNYTINDFEIYGTENITKIKSPLELAI